MAFPTRTAEHAASDASYSIGIRAGTIAAILHQRRPRQLTCPRCHRHWWTTTRHLEQPYTRDIAGCPNCGPKSGYDVA